MIGVDSSGSQEVAPFEVESAVELLQAGAGGKCDDGGKRKLSLSSSSKRRRGKKSWAHASEEETSRDAEQVGCDPEVAKGIVGCVTTFATLFCFVIVVVKAALFAVTLDPAIQTSMLDSIGDAMANGILKYTSCRMASQNFLTYPDGQYRFESVAVLIFSSFMFTMMFQQACSLGASLLQAFFAADPADFAHRLCDGLPFPIVQGDERMIGGCDYFIEQVYRDSEKKDTFQKYLPIVVLYICAAYKLVLALYCYLYAIPKTGSGVLRAIAADKRNDFFFSATMASCKLLAIQCKKHVKGNVATKLLEQSDSLLGLLGSLFLAGVWASSALEQFPIVTSAAMEEEDVAGVAEAVEEVLQRDGSGLSFGLDLCHLSAGGGLAELHLKSYPSVFPCGKWDEVKKQLAKALEGLDTVSRTVILMG